MIPKLTKAIPEENYRLTVFFEDGLSGTIDLSDLPGNGVFKAWNNVANFFSFRIDKDGKLIWSDDIDMDPDSFYLQLIGKTFEEYAGN